MKKSNIFKIAAIGLLSFVFVACSKYEEGSKFTLLTKKMRMVNNWNLDKAEYTNGSSTTTQTYSGESSMELKKDNTYSATLSSGSFSFTSTGTWDFSSDKTQLIMTDSDGDVTTSTIIMLKNNELKLQQVDGSTTSTFFYSTK